MERPYKVLIVTDGHLSEKHFIDILPTLLYARQGGIPAPSRYRGFLLPLASFPAECCLLQRSCAFHVAQRNANRGAALFMSRLR